MADTERHLYEPAAVRAELMPAHERALLDIFNAPVGSLGLMSNSRDEPIAAWQMIDMDPDEGYGEALTTASPQQAPWISTTAHDPIAWLDTHATDLEKPATAWEITLDALTDLAAHSRGQTQTCDAIKSTLAEAEPGRFFIIATPEATALFARTAHGWSSSNDGWPLIFTGPYPQTDPADLATLKADEHAYDTPFIETPIPHTTHPWSSTGERTLTHVRSVTTIAALPQLTTIGKGK